MSASAPKTSREAAGPGPGGGRWYLGALLFHALLLGALLWMAPRWADDGHDEEPVERTMSAREVRELRQTIESSARARIERDLARLEEIRAELAESERRRLDDLKADLPESDPEQTLAAMRQVADSLRESAGRMEEGQQLSAEAEAPPFDEIDRRLDEALAGLPLGDPELRPLLGGLDEVRSLHDRARQAWSRGQVDDSEFADAKDDAERRWHDADKKQAELEKRERRVGESRGKVDEERRKLAEYEAELQLETDADKRRRLTERIAKQEDRVADREQRVVDDLATVEEIREDLKERLERAEAAAEQVDQQLVGLDGHRAGALEAERAALAAQERTIAHLERILAGEGPAEPSSPAEWTAGQAYELALRRESEITTSFKLWRSAELARMRGIPLSEALRQTDVVRPERPAPAPGEGGGLEEGKRRLEGMLRETASMVSLAENLLGIARRREARRSDGHAVALERANSRQRLASVDASGAVADLTTLGNGGAGAAGDGTGGPGGAGGPDDGAQSGGGGNAPPPQEVRPGAIGSFARRISAAGEPTRWMSPNSWYVIGPFGNPGREHIDRSFPPESVIDLDASYVGKDHRVIRWQYQPAEDAKVVPRNEESYGIWYASTELWSDRPRDVWLALGSDDQGRLWVNGELVWISGSGHKDWTLGEALRRVSLVAGRNRLLYRIENGHGGMAFSLCVSLHEE